MSLEPPEKTRKLQQTLYTLAKQKPSYRFYLLYDKVYREDILGHAWALVRDRRGAPGVDGVTFESIEARGIAELLLELQEELRTQTYKPSPVRRVMIPKPGGGQRPLGIPTIRDRVAQMAAKLVLEPIFEADFDEAAYGYRPKRDAIGAVEAVQKALREGRTEVLDADLTKYFDTIPHSELITCLARRISDGKVLRLLKMWLKVPVEETDDRGHKRMTGGKKSKCGVPQGGVISPLLANIYMHRFIKAFRKYNLAEQFGAELVNYADDFVVLCRRNVAQVYERVARWMNQIGLELNAKKTRTLNAWCTPFDFLGYTFGSHYTWGTTRRHLGTAPSKKSVARFRENIRAVLASGNHAPIEEIVAALNRKISGWANYFRFGRVVRIRRALDEYLVERVRAFLRRRSNTAGRGTRRYSYDYIRGLGLRSMLAAPRLQPAHARV
jgi:RNA-directed DNA polymerase